MWSDLTRKVSRMNTTGTPRNLVPATTGNTNAVRHGVLPHEQGLPLARRLLAEGLEREQERTSS